MTTPVRQQILDAVGSRLKTINGTGGYVSDFSAGVFEWAPGPIETEALPAVIYRETDCDTADSNTDRSVSIGMHRHRLQIEVEAKMKGSASTADIRQAIADIWKAIGVEAGGATPGRWGGLAVMTDPQGDAIATNIQDKMYASAIIKFMITFRTPEWDPYTAV